MLQGIALHPAQPVGMGLSLGNCGRGVGMCQDPRNRAVHVGEAGRWGKEGGSEGYQLGRGRDWDLVSQNLGEVGKQLTAQREEVLNDCSRQNNYMINQDWPYF